MTRPRSIHVVEDDEDITKLVLFNLSMAGYQVSTSTSGEDALNFLSTEKTDLILLDLMLPGISGTDVCKQLRQDKSFDQIPIIMVTAKDEAEDVVDGFKSGADDYIGKPFSPRVLIARIENALKKVETASHTAKLDVIVIETLEIQLKKYEVSVSEEKIKLTRSEFQILVLLAKKPGWVFSRSQIVDEIRGQGYAVTDRAIDFQMVGLRKKLGEAGSLIETVRGVGYRIRMAK